MQLVWVTLTWSSCVKYCATIMCWELNHTLAKFSCFARIILKHNLAVGYQVPKPQVNIFDHNNHCFIAHSTVCAHILFLGVFCFVNGTCLKKIRYSRLFTNQKNCTYVLERTGLRTKYVTSPEISRWKSSVYARPLALNRAPPNHPFNKQRCLLPIP